ncbi:MAG: hypothetical protein ACE37F_09010 [Nannocystaceae bacterium]|nr:hypothetical protein [bacterium]
MRRFALMLVLFGAGGCGYKWAAKVIDPTLAAGGTVLERGEGSRTSFTIGAYSFAQESLDREAVAGSTGLSPDGQARPTERIDLQLTMQVEGRRWGGACRALREPTGRADYAAVTDEFHDVVKIDCTFDDGAGATWVLAMAGSLAANLGGTLEPKHASFAGGGLEVEVLMWRNVWQRVRRHLPEALGQVRANRKSTAAMVLARPEKAWLDSGAPGELLDISMVTLGALRMLPLGFEG